MFIRRSYGRRWETFFCACQKKVPPDSRKEKRFGARIAFLPVVNREHAEPTSVSLNVTTHLCIADRGFASRPLRGRYTRRGMVAGSYDTHRKGRRPRRPAGGFCLYVGHIRNAGRLSFVLAKRKPPRPRKEKRFGANLAFLPVVNRKHAEPTSVSLNVTTYFCIADRGFASRPLCGVYTRRG